MNKPCKVENCFMPISAGGYCRKHISLRTDKKCSAPGCESGMYAKGLCRKHWNGARYIPKTTSCLAPDCPKKVWKYDYCPKHLKQVEKGRPFDNDRRGPNNPRWNGGVSAYPNHSEFKRMRLEKLQQVEGKCEECGQEATEVHHLDGSKDNHALENLKALCHKCHLGIYHKDRKYKPTLAPGITLKTLSERTGLSVLVLRKYLHEYRPKIEAALSEVKP